MTGPLINICIPTYNGEEYITQCIQSALGQTYTNIEILFVDDCSTDNTLGIIESFAKTDNRIKLVRNEKNLGLVANWNKCIDIAKGEWIKFLFQDDYLDIDCIEVMLQGVSPNDKLITSGRRLIFDPGLYEATKKYSINETLSFERLGINAQKPVSISPEKISSLVVSNLCMNFIGEPTVVMFRKEVTKEVGLFNNDLYQICDLEYFLRIGTKYGVKYIPKPLSYFRVHRKSTSSSHMKDKLFTLAHIDPVVNSHQLLYSPRFASFRSSLSALQKMRLNLFFRERVHEAQTMVSTFGKENIDRFEFICNKYPEIGANRRGNIFIKLIFQVIKLRRAI
jgi:glycosyltransferase involved in cell wall biosynthesis